MRRITYLIAVLAAILVQGCGNETPACADERTVGLIKQIFRKSLEQLVADRQLDPSLMEQISSQIQLRVATIVTNASDEKIHKFECEGVLEAVLPPRGERTVNLREFRTAMAIDPATTSVQVSGNVIKHNIHYTSRVTDDGNQHLVEMNGHTPIVEVAIALGANDLLFGDSKDVSSNAPGPVAARPKVFPDLTRYIGQPTTEVLKETAVAKAFATLLGTDYPSFVEGLATSDGLQLIGDYYFGAGCVPHVCSIEEAAFAIHKTTGQSYAARLTDGKTIRVYGVANGREMPEPLRQWWQDRVSR
jgi:hypothetical protein